MKKFLMAVAALVCMGGVAFAGPNAGGTIIAHDANLQYTTDILDYCGLGTPLSVCEGADVNLASSGGTQWVWKVYAAFIPGSSPRLKGMTFGITYPGAIALVQGGLGPCIGDPNNGAAEFPGAGWPGTGTGTSLVFQFTQTSELVECYWFAGYDYYGAPALFELGPHPDPVLGGNFADDSVPAIQDPITCFGTLGFNMDGLACCPDTDPEGACCVNEVCSITTELNCPGDWQGAGTDCDPDPCIPPPDRGACCFGVECVVLEEIPCTDQGGEWQGPNTVCEPNPCEQPPMACCFPDGHCEYVTAADCEALGGIPQGYGTDCEPNDCPQPPPEGACCLDDQGTCEVMTEAECIEGGGEYQGDDTTCDPNPCPIVPTQNTTWGRIKANYR